jgi:CubicO group peptidase (beta-lactamase class C family)
MSAAVNPERKIVTSRLSICLSHVLRLGLATGLAAAMFGCGSPQPPLAQVAEIIGIDFGDEGLSGIRRFAIDRVLDFRVASGARAGFVALVANDEGLVYARTAGFADLELEKAMTLDTRFQLASMTKPITAVAAMILVEDGKLTLDDPVSKYLPSFVEMEVVTSRTEEGGWNTAPLSSPILVRHLLTFTSGIGGYEESEDLLGRAWRSPDIEIAGLGSLADRISLIPKLPLYEPPGTKWRYGWSADVLARVVEVAAGRAYDQFLLERVFDPLGMDQTNYPDDVPDDAPFAKMYTHDEDGDLLHDPQFDDYYGSGWTPGGGGLVSSGPDFLRFAMMLANGGALGGVRILSEQTVAEMTRLHVPDGVLADMDLEGLGWGLGMCVVADDTKTLMPATNGDFWWSGRFGTQFWVSPAKRTVVVVMQQTERGPYSDMPVTPALVQILSIP